MNATRDVPRLTGVLRVALSGREPADLAKEMTQRDRQMRELQKVLQVQELGGEGQLTWQAFVEGVEEPDEARMRKMRATYNLFLAELKDLVGDENLSSAELHEVAHLVYQVLSDAAKPLQQKTAALAKLVREAPTKKIVDSLQSHVSALEEWKQSVTVVNADGERVTKTKQARKEFGSHLLFSFDPPDFCSRAVRVVSKTSELVKLPPPPPQQQQQQQAKGAPSAAKAKGSWLEEECSKYLAQSGSSTNAGDVLKSIVSVAKSAQSAEALQGQLFDLLGPEGLDLMERVVEKWPAVKAMSMPKATASPDASVSYAPTPGGMSVVLEQDKKAQQQRRKQEKRLHRAGGADSDGAAGGTHQLEHFARVLEDGDRASLPAASRDDDYVAGGAAQAAEAKFHMPEGAKRVDTVDYESVWLPPKYPGFRDDSTLVPVTVFEPWARNAFKGYERLNRIQSSVFASAYKSNENLLICAPTGAGKTNIAMLAILREIGQNMEDGVLQKDRFKIVYVAPMKALASEMTAGFGSRLAYLGVSVRELTGDMQLTKQEIEDTQIIVTTPEKWDVITRKSTDSPLTQIVHLLIFDEVHLLNEDRGPVIETLVARTLRQVESSQSMIRIVGLSATLPNYKDVAQFMRVNETSGLHYFDGSFRPVPLEQTFVGVKAKGFQKQRSVMTTYCYDTILQTLKKEKQCMVFVHSRKDTTKTAQDLLQMAEEHETADLFSASVRTDKNAEWARREIDKSRNSDVRRLFLAGFAIHHAGMLRSDRNLVEKMFHQGLIKVLVCTATLAWGVNLPCKQVIIKGTQVYNAEKGKFCSLGMLDVMQIFGRAGRPQFDDEGSAVMITTHDELYRYLALTSHQAPIESQFTKGLSDNLNAEIVLGTVTNIQEAVAWLSYTYLFVRMQRNPMVYGISYEESHLDPNLVQKRTELIVAAANELDDVRMIRFNNPYFASTSLGQTASHYYICHETIRGFNEAFEKKANSLTLADVFRIISNASEFENVISREEELPELDKMKTNCPVEIKGDPAGDKTVKVNILLQSYISSAPVNAFALVCDTNFVAQNAGRVARGLFEIALRKGLPDAASLLLKLCKMIELRVWDTMHPLRQFPNLSLQVVGKFEERGLTVDRLLDMEPSEISAITRVPAVTPTVLACLGQIPFLEVETSVQPITRTIIRIRATLRPNFRWNDRLHGPMQPFWIWVENPVEVGILHHEYFMLRKKENNQPSEIVFTTPISHPVPPQYILHICSDRWFGSDNTVPLSFKHLILPQLYPPHTQLLDLQPLPVKALGSPVFESVFKYEFFNPIQTQIFHTLYHTDQNVLLGAPTGSGKTVAAELAVMRLFNTAPHLKAVYLGPLKALVQERLKDWGSKFVDKMGKKMVELTGEFTPDVFALKQADIICTTPEKWDGVSRSWQNRGYVTSVGLLIIDEIHLLGEDRGPILEVIVSRMRHIASKTKSQVRVVGLSTALANAKDLADWLGIERAGLFNFHPSVRPVPLKIHVQGYEGAQYCPRMAKMNRPAYAAILAYSSHKPALIFVSSRRQTRLTAMDIISHVAGDGAPRRFVIGDENMLQRAVSRVRDANLKHCLSFGIGLHHAGLTREDRAHVEELFEKCVIQVLISTATLAWGVNLPAHLVIVKGCEYYDAKTHRYVDYAITDILQMMGRAGRPQFDDSGEAVIMCTSAMKGFYKKFLYEPFPVESSLADVLHDHLNAEIVAGTLTTKHDAVDWITWTYLYRRLLVNPTYYGLETCDLPSVNKFLSGLVDETLRDLEASHCIDLDEDGTTIWALTMGKIVSYYYLNHLTARMFFSEIDESSDVAKLLQVLSSAKEYEELPVRHNEDGMNEELAGEPGVVAYPLQSSDWENPGVKANLLLQCHLGRAVLPISDYITDQKSVLDQAIRILQAMIDVSADGGWLWTTFNCMHLMQMVSQAQLLDETPLKQIGLAKSIALSLPQLVAMSSDAQRAALRGLGGEKALSALAKLPLVKLEVSRPSKTEVSVRITKTKGSANGSAHAPFFPKHKREGWWIVIGDASERELFVLKRVTLRLNSATTVKLALEEEQAASKNVWLYCVSDSYIGLDSQIFISAAQ